MFFEEVSYFFLHQVLITNLLSVLFILFDKQYFTQVYKVCIFSIRNDSSNTCLNSAPRLPL